MQSEEDFYRSKIHDFEDNAELNKHSANFNTPYLPTWYTSFEIKKLKKRKADDFSDEVIKNIG